MLLPGSLALSEVTRTGLKLRLFWPKFDGVVYANFPGVQRRIGCGHPWTFSSVFSWTSLSYRHILVGEIKPKIRTKVINMFNFRLINLWHFVRLECQLFCSFLHKDTPQISANQIHFAVHRQLVAGSKSTVLVGYLEMALLKDFILKHIAGRIWPIIR